MLDSLNGFDVVDFDDQDGMFEAVLAALPDDIIVYPSEGYYYFWFYHHGNLVRGNLRFGYDLRDEGRLAFAYYYDIGHSPANKAYTKFKIFESSDDFSLIKEGSRAYRLRYKAKTINVTLPIPVSNYRPRDGEVHVGDMMDESGIVFALVFNEAASHFFYILDQSKDYEFHEDLSDNLSIGTRSSFVFYNRGDDKILVGVRRDKVTANTFYDGPFDQLPEHSLDAADFESLVKKAYPHLTREINSHGQYTELESMRIAVDNYSIYDDVSHFAPLDLCPQADQPENCLQQFLDAN